MVTPGRASGPVVADLTVGQPAVDVLPLEQLAEAARAALPGNPKALLYTHTEGAAELIDVVRAKLRHYEGLDLDRDQVAITNGSGQAIDMILRTFTELDGPLALDEASFGALPARRTTNNGPPHPIRPRGSATGGAHPARPRARTAISVLYDADVSKPHGRDDEHGTAPRVVAGLPHSGHSDPGG